MVHQALVWHPDDPDVQVEVNSHDITFSIAFCCDITPVKKMQDLFGGLQFILDLITPMSETATQKAIEEHHLDLFIERIEIQVKDLNQEVDEDKLRAVVQRRMVAKVPPAEIKGLIEMAVNCPQFDPDPTASARAQKARLINNHSSEHHAYINQLFKERWDV